ncbi:class I SAM-dependent methyltransferase [Frigidibacter oleivorans]|uniref:class I SAM-dependent methyltransferase n=1 Tax=Frigidibacter oleivorans TaxID=2487129 RepID=UPI000F8C9AC3|nr:class I SAM-dependent methyltransferase [Frigidibacter oleivorans]
MPDRPTRGQGLTSPYLAPGFYDSAIAGGRHRAIVGGRWDETGRAQMDLLVEAGLRPHHHLLDIGAGALRLGCKAVPYLDPGHYWATDADRGLMLAGHAAELADPARLNPAQLVEDADFAFPGIPDRITHAIAFAVFPHLPAAHLARALTGLTRFPALESLLFTVFLAPEAAAAGPVRQPDGVVTHPARPPYHLTAAQVHDLAAATGWGLTRLDRMLPRGQVAFAARPLRGAG